ncbi:MAG TPA: molybdopterin-dependent oxidoreductase [Thermohalobaculum sp.]|nr:molybdopterin-dependent oxidoreductase [Thermohalobaculum sp.]
MTIRNALPRIFACILVAAVIVAGTATPSAAEDLLILSNATDPAQAAVHLSEADLLALPQVTIRTRTEFTDGVAEFVGPLVRDVLALIKTGTATSAHLVAANDYAIDAPLSDFTNYGVILAMQVNGERLSRRDKGPLWVMYPLDDHAELQDPYYTIRLVWQLIELELR